MTTPLTFVDTNVLLYAHSDSSDRHDRAREVLAELWERRSGVISTQVLQEFYVNATKPTKLAMKPAEARRLVALYSTWRVIPADSDLVLAASHLQEDHTVSFWDALIVRAALRASASVLLSEDLQHGRRFGPLEVRDPFRVESGDRGGK